MARNRKSSRKNRVFRIESLERREMMSASPWATATDIRHEPTAAAVAALNPGQPAATAQVQAQSLTQAAATVRPRPFVASVVGGVLKIQATGGERMISVHQALNRQGQKILIIDARLLNGSGLDGTPYVGTPQVIELKGISKIEYRGTNAADRFRNQTALPSTAYGFGGNDTLEGGSKRDVLYGGAGNDRLEGKNGNDVLYGQAGNDYLYGGNDNDTLDGGAEGDYLDGQAGYDTAINPKLPGDILKRIESPTSVAFSALAQTTLQSSNATTGQSAATTLRAAGATANALDKAFEAYGVPSIHVLGTNRPDSGVTQVGAKDAKAGAAVNAALAARMHTLMDGKLDNALGNRVKADELLL